MPDEGNSQLQDLKDKIKTWANRAEMARKQVMSDNVYCRPEKDLTPDSKDRAS